MNKLTKNFYVGALLLAFSAVGEAAPDRDQKSFATADEAVKALVESVKASDREKTIAILGKKSELLIESGDPVEDQKDRSLFLNAYNDGNKLEKVSDTEFILILGKDNWSFPIPVVKESKGWYFNTAAGMKEILSRRIGRNELFTIKAMLAFVDAEREYYQLNPEKEKQPVYAQQLFSSSDKRNGLYYSVKEGEAASPLGALYAKASAAGYSKTESETGAPEPFFGYYYRVLTSQGKNAAGGARDYMKDDKMTEGYALIAWPAKYHDSGVMTFMVNQHGIVYEKDLGDKTEQEAQKITSFDPDKTWKIVKEIP